MNIFVAFRESIRDRSLLNDFKKNLWAGITVGIVALPLSMGLAIASGVAPQHGLYTAIIAGFFIALFGGSRTNISGPTAAYVVVLLPIVQQYGLGGLAISGLLAGCILIIMGLARLGRIIEVVPYPVIVGFTSGIGVVIATIQLKDFFGFSIAEFPNHYHEKIIALIEAIPTLQWEELAIGIVTFIVIASWRQTKSKIPAYLVALVVGAILAQGLAWLNASLQVDTIASRFHFNINGVSGSGIPPIPPEFIWPWQLPNANGQPIGLSWSLLESLLGASFAIALLGALESLLCAVVADGMSGYKHQSDAELIGQGVGNLLVPFFAGIPATAAIARTATNIRAGGNTPIAAMVHAVVILIAMILFAKFLGYIPMTSMAAVLIMVAWNMSEAHHALRIIRFAPRADTLVFFTCFLLTVFLDMQIAVAAGMALASIIFIRRTIELTGSTLVDHTQQHVAALNVPENVVVYDIDGPLFFGAAQKALKTLTQIDKNMQAVVLDMSGVSMLDVTAMVALESIVNDFAKNKKLLILSNLVPRIRHKLHRYGLQEKPGNLLYADDLEKAFLLVESRN